MNQKNLKRNLLTKNYDAVLKFLGLVRYSRFRGLRRIGKQRVKDIKELRKEVKKRKAIIAKVKKSIWFDLQCPMCLRVYRTMIDLTRPMLDEHQPDTVAHCVHCKKHPVLMFSTRWHIVNQQEIVRKR